MVGSIGKSTTRRIPVDFGRIARYRFNEIPGRKYSTPEKETTRTGGIQLKDQLELKGWQRRDDTTVKMSFFQGSRALSAEKDGGIAPSEVNETFSGRISHLKRRPSNFPAKDSGKKAFPEPCEPKGFEQGINRQGIELNFVGS